MSEIPKPSSQHVINPVTGEVENLENLPESGYKYRFLRTLSALENPDLIDIGASPMLAFDKERWSFEVTEGQVVLTKREPETRLDGAVLNEHES